MVIVSPRKKNKEKPQGYGNHSGAGVAINLRLDVCLCSRGPHAILVQHTYYAGPTFGPHLQHAPLSPCPPLLLSLIPIYPSLAQLLVARLGPRGSLSTGMPTPLWPLPNGPALTRFALLSRQILLGFLLLLFYQPHFLQQAHQTAAQGGLFLWFLLFLLQLNSCRWSKREGVSLICLLIQLLNHSLFFF